MKSKVMLISLVLNIIFHINYLNAQTSGAGTSMSFNGTTNCYVETGLRAKAAQFSNWTIECWVKGTNAPAQGSRYNGPIYGYSTFAMIWDHGSAGFVGAATVHNTVNAFHPTSYGALSSNTWYHLAATFDGTNLRTYKNGLLVNTTAFSGTLQEDLDSDPTLRLGSHPNSATNAAMNGQIDEVRIWKTARSQADIQAWMLKNYDLADPQNTALESYYKFNEGSGSATTDEKNNHNGTRTGAAAFVTSTAPVGQDGKIVTTASSTTIGTAGKQLIITIAGASSSNYWGVYTSGQGAAAVTTETFPAGVDERSDILWGIVQFGNLNANLVIDYSSISGISDRSALKVLKRNNASSAWTDVTASFTNNTGDGTFTSTSSVNTAAEYTIGANTATNPLPVELSSFNAYESEGNVILEWSTATEVNNYGFEVERQVGSMQSAVGNQNNPKSAIRNLQWELVGFVEGNVNSNSPKEYSFIDTNPTSGNLQYRLKQIDTDGQFQYYSETAEVNYNLTGINEKQLPTEFDLLQNYPNPFNPVTVISYAIGTGQIPVGTRPGVFVQLKVYDLLGKEVATLVNEVKEPGHYNIKFDGSNLSTGVYIYRLYAGSFTSTKKLVLMK